MIGGTGFVGSAVCRLAADADFHVTAVGRGNSRAQAGVHTLVVDRRQPGALEEAIASLDVTWDLVVDCAAYEQADIVQDLDLFRSNAGHLVYISSDAVFDPGPWRFPRDARAGYTDVGYGGAKRACERILEEADRGSLTWTVLRPTHIYGPGSELGCQPWHLRDPDLITKLRAGRPLTLVAGGTILQQPIYVDDLARLALSCPAAAHAHGGAFLAVGPEIVEAREYYRLIADHLGVDIVINEATLAGYLEQFPHMRSVLTHRAYCDQRQHLEAAGLTAPTTPLAIGLAAHVDHVLSGRTRGG